MGPNRRCRKIERLPAQSELDGLVVVLVRPRNPLNIGAAARAMSNFGAHRLRLVNPFAEGFREARSAVGASDLLHQAEERGHRIHLGRHLLENQAEIVAEFFGL